MQYDLAGRLTDIVGSDGTRATLAYDTKGNMQSLIMKDGGNAVSAALYSFLEDNNLLDKINLPLMDNGEIKYNYGDFNRVDSISHTMKESNQNLKVKTEFEYLTSGTNQTGLVGSMSNKRYSGTSVDENFGTLSYTYDPNGNITTISENGTLKVTYTYDGLNQLVREDDISSGQTITYTYDDGGNILNRHYHPYTTEALEEEEYVSEYNLYEYEDENWKDKLTSYGGMPLIYDENGNVIDFGEGFMTFTWEKGRQLSETNMNGTEISYKYNASGLRTEKTVNGVTTEFTYAGSLLMSQDDGTNRLDFVYDAGGTMIGFKHVTEDVENNYYYLRNLQGDVIGIYDSDGEIVCRYTYSTWGYMQNIFDENGSIDYYASHIGNLNPIRYRGYYFDRESDFYYLQSRYYSPEICRFINADALFVAGDTLTGSNMFAYCGNNPVMFVDPSGYSVEDDIFVAAWINTLLDEINYKHITNNIDTSTLKCTREVFATGLEKITVSFSTIPDYFPEPERSHIIMYQTNYEITGFLGTKDSWNTYLRDSYKARTKNIFAEIINTIAMILMAVYSIFNPTSLIATVPLILDSMSLTFSTISLLQLIQIKKFEEFVENKIDELPADAFFAFIYLIQKQEIDWGNTYGWSNYYTAY